MVLRIECCCYLLRCYTLLYSPSCASASLRRSRSASLRSWLALPVLLLVLEAAVFSFGLTVIVMLMLTRYCRVCFKIGNKALPLLFSLPTHFNTARQKTKNHLLPCPQAGIVIRCPPPQIAPISRPLLGGGQG